MDEFFGTFEAFINKYALDEITVPVCIYPPENDIDYWVIQVFLVGKSQIKTCIIRNGNQQKITKYKVQALSYYEDLLMLDWATKKKYQNGKGGSIKCKNFK